MNPVVAADCVAQVGFALWIALRAMGHRRQAAAAPAPAVSPIWI